MKFLLTAALIAILGWLLYRRLRPYILMVKQFFGLLGGTIEPGKSQSELRRNTQDADNRLVRCAQCSTWVPQGRAISANSTLYCSRVCLEKAAKAGRRKAAS